MYKHILLPTDGSKLSDKAVNHAINLAKATGAKVTAMHVTPEFPDSGANEGRSVSTPAIIKKRFNEELAEMSAELFGRVRANALAAGVKCDCVTVPDNSPYHAIIAQAVKGKCDLIVMASHGRRGLSGILIGSETVKVLTHSKIPVTVVR